MYLKASLHAPRNRAGITAGDFPERHGDPAWIVIRDGHDGMDLCVPTRSRWTVIYPVKPHRYYMDNFALPQNIGHQGSVHSARSHIQRGSTS